MEGVYDAHTIWERTDLAGGRQMGESIFIKSALAEGPGSAAGSARIGRGRLHAAQKRTAGVYELKRGAINFCWQGTSTARIRNTSAGRSGDLHVTVIRSTFNR